MAKADFLKECISDPALVEPGKTVPIDAFTKAYCLRCDNRECARSGANNMAFDDRVKNWQERLFRNPPRARPDDPVFANIRTKNFAPVTAPLSVQGNAGFVPVPAPTLVQPPPPPPPPPAVEIPSPEAEAAPEPAQAVVHEASGTSDDHQPQPQDLPTKQGYNQGTRPANTKFQQGAVLPGGPQGSPKDRIVEPGATFTFGEDE